MKRYPLSHQAILTSLILAFGLLFPSGLSSARSLADPPRGEIVLLDRNQSAATKITDGDQVRIRVTLAEKVSAPLRIDFFLDGETGAVGDCEIQSNSNDCQTGPIASLGWHWQAGGLAGQSRTILAEAAGNTIGRSQAVQVAARPVVMVHGFSSSWEAWKTYLGPSGFLAANGLQGFAVGDGQEPGVMNTGNFSAPTQRTNTIAENAAILGSYITAVKKATGAQEVDLISHSMGGLISRYYIDRVMKERDVAQLIMLGSPMAGTDCASLPAALGLYLPATLELRPSYVRAIFDEQITHRHGVPFYALAGVPILDAFKSPCTEVPSDLAVSLNSVTAIALHTVQMPVLHMDLNISGTVFNDYVKPLLQTPSGGYPEQADPERAAPDESLLQFTRIYTGHVDLGGSQEVTIRIDPSVTVASFALYDTTRSLNVSVRGASGNVIALSPEKNGLVVVRDPSTLFYLGYGFQNPKPGIWRVTLSATDQTPARGSDYALTAYFVGGSELKAQLNTLVPRVNESVQLTATLSLAGQALSLTDAQALVHGPDGNTIRVAMALSEGRARASWKPEAPGLYGVDVQVTGNGPDGSPVERTAFLSFETQPVKGMSRGELLALAAVPVLVIVILAGIWIWRRNRRLRSG